MSGPSLVVVGLSSTKDPLSQIVYRMPNFLKMSGALLVNGMVNLGIRVFNSIVFAKKYHPLPTNEENKIKITEVKKYKKKTNYSIKIKG